ncbi:MAG: HlyC/CorC family transporter [Betaproteobacteria bacterium]|jgi:putative hemolysin|nr:HlyC/CorC family transporter [Betaproteobacteria bacterium]
MAWLEVALLFFLIFINGLFAMTEIALVTARRSRLQRHVDEGDRSAAAAVRLGEDPTRFLSTVQIGITSIGILNGIVGEMVLAQPLALWLESQYEFKEGTAGLLATGLVVVVVTYVSIVLGELVPKRLGQIHPEAIARAVARPMLWLAAATRPFGRLLTGSTELVLGLFGVNARGMPAVTQEEIDALLAEGSESGAIEAQEHAMVRNVFRLDDRQIGSLMVPRGDVVVLDRLVPTEENLRRLEASEHSRFPVVRGGLHDVVGVVAARALLGATLRGEPLDLAREGLLQPPVFVPESLTGMELLENFRSSGVQLAFVIDEYGEVLGIVTLQDVMEAITGEFKPRHAEDAWAVQRTDGSWLLDGLIPVPELKDRLGLRSVPEEDKGRFHTLSGMMMLMLGRLPGVTDRVVWEDWSFEIVDMDAKRIDKVLAVSIGKPEAVDALDASVMMPPVA